MKIALAQIQSFSGQLIKNLETHYRLIEKAALKGADFICFPELSISAYEPELAAALATTIDDPIFDQLQAKSDKHQIIIGAGMPIKSTEGIYIGMIIFQQGEPKQLYCKINLHADEMLYFIPGKQPFQFQFGRHTISLAICYESLLFEHAEHAAANGATIYLASVAKSEKGIKKAYGHYPDIAQKFEMSVLMVNGIGPMDNFVGAGGSGAWDTTGKKISQLANEEGVLMIDLE